MDLLDRLLGHDRWTTAELLRRCGELSPGQFDQEFDIGWRTLRRTFIHMIANQRTWTDLMNGVDASHSTDGWWDFDLAQLIAAHEASYGDLLALAYDMREHQRWNQTFVDTLDSPPATKSLGGGVLHVVTHNMHHRSEILHILERLGLRDLPEGDLLSWEALELTEKGVV
jgi:uncharacterized damage-inducible protein DinB